MARALENWDNHLSEQPDDAEARAKRAELLKKRDEFEIGELRRRIAANPSDAESQFRLGTALARVERWDEAIAAFQQARNDVAWKVRALTEAGVCFERIGSAKLAERSFSDALKNLAPDQTAMFNDLHYRLGTLAERLGKLQEAEDHYNEVAANDFGYKDVAKRLRDIQTKM
jgi:Tfp pilus assembly protein PilF